MYRNILVPHAGNDSGDLALKHAIAIAKGDGAKITILHVVEDIPIPLSLAYFERESLAKNVDQIKSEMKKEMHKQLDTKATDLKKQGVKIDIVVAHGHPDKEIAQISAIKEFDLIVMAKRRNLRGIMGVLKLGSVSRKVLERVSCPLLLIDSE